jgi:hypothetical protein
MSAGFIGAARARRRSVDGGRDGDMECVCRLKKEDCQLLPREVKAISKSGV